MIRELEKLNIQFNSLSQKKSSLINNNKNYNSVQPISHENLELSELNIQKKYLTNLISEYNTLYNKFNDENENEVIELKKEIKEKKNEINKYFEENKILKDKIFNNQNYLKTNKQKKVFFQDENLDDKSELYQKKIFFVSRADAQPLRMPDAKTVRSYYILNMLTLFLSESRLL